MSADIKNFLDDERGATAIEYALLAGAIGLVIITAVTAIGNAVKADFQAVSAGFDRA